MNLIAVVLAGVLVTALVVGLSILHQENENFLKTLKELQEEKGHGSKDRGSE